MNFFASFPTALSVVGSQNFLQTINQAMQTLSGNATGQSAAPRFKQTKYDIRGVNDLRALKDFDEPPKNLIVIPKVVHFEKAKVENVVKEPIVVNDSRIVVRKLFVAVWVTHSALFFLSVIPYFL